MEERTMSTKIFLVFNMPWEQACNTLINLSNFRISQEKTGHITGLQVN